jgi:hypothetical protein
LKSQIVMFLNNFLLNKHFAYVSYEIHSIVDYATLRLRLKNKRAAPLRAQLGEKSKNLENKTKMY